MTIWQAIAAAGAVTWLCTPTYLRGRSSTVERDVANVEAVGSSPAARFHTRTRTPQTDGETVANRRLGADGRSLGIDATAAGANVARKSPPSVYGVQSSGTSPHSLGAGSSGVEPCGGGSPGTPSLGSSVNATPDGFALTAALGSEGTA